MLSALGLILFPVVISFFWSNNIYEWLQAVTGKLLFFIIIPGIIYSNITSKQFGWLIWILSGVLFTACCWSVINYLYHFTSINQSYLVAKVMPTLMDNDHIRFSWLIVLNMILLGWKLSHQSVLWERKTGMALLVFFFFFIHFLASKTGLICLYTTIFVFILYFIFFSGRKRLGVALFITTIFILASSYLIFPTLSNRIQYVTWDFKQYSKNIFLQGSSDGGRILSIKCGVDITKANPLLGVGFGDLRAETNKWFVTHSPATEMGERFIPQTEILIYAAAGGLIGLLFLVIGIVMLFKPLFNKNVFSIAMAVVLLLPLFFDDCFEAQFAIVIFSLLFSFAILAKKYYNFRS